MDSDSIRIIIIFYNPTDRHKEQAVRLSRYYHIIIVDNTRGVYNGMTDNSYITYIPLGDNKGIAYAQNVGIKKAIESGAEFILFQDQDSSLAVEDVELLLKEYKDVKKDDNNIAAIGPVIINEEDGQEYKSEIGSKITNKVCSIISSGMLTEVAVINEIGGMDESLFIDNVDHEWCWRAKNKGFNIYITRKVILKHSVGERSKKIFGMQLIKSSSSRSYFKYRNNIWLIKRSYVPLFWKFKTIIHMVLDYFIYALCFKTYGKAYVRYANKGIKEGLLKKNEPVF